MFKNHLKSGQSGPVQGGEAPSIDRYQAPSKGGCYHAGGMTQKKPLNPDVRSVYDRLLAHFGPQKWWPADSPLEMCVGAILTQNTSWSNVDKALHQLKEHGCLTLLALAAIDEQELARLIRSSGYFNLKARRLKAFVRFVIDGYGDLATMLASPFTRLRPALLAVYGIGPETADSILLYAAHQPVFVIDAYTTRITSRIGWVEAQVRYDDLQVLFMNHLPAEAPLFNEYHALWVMLGKDYCRPRAPRCGLCPLKSVCAEGRRSGAGA